MLSWMLPRRAVHACVGDSLEPIIQVLSDGGLVLEVLAVEAVTLDVLDPGLHLALALRVIALAGMDGVPDGIRILVEAVGQRQQIGRASGRERGGRYGWDPGG